MHPGASSSPKTCFSIQKHASDVTETSHEFVSSQMFGLFSKKPEVCNVLGDSITLRLTAEQTNGKYCVAEFATPGGIGQPPHTHDWNENYVILEGELNLNIGGHPAIIATGDSYLVKAGTVHAPTPNGDFCRYVTIGQPGGVESLFKSLKANEKELGEMNKVVEIITKAGVKIAG